MRLLFSLLSFVFASSVVARSVDPFAAPPPLDPKLQKTLEGVKPIDYSLIPTDQLRTGFAKRMSEWRKLDEKIKRVEDKTLTSGIKLRLYTPETRLSSLPILLYFHGGGWVVGDLDTHDDVCRSIAKRGEALVVAVDYRLAPENKFPAALEDGFAALQWVYEQAKEIGGDRERIGVVGDSAGGNLAAALALYARDHNGPKIASQVLIYPATNYNFDTLSYFQNESGYRLTRASMIYFWNQYLATPDDGAKTYASPLRADNLSGLPPALILTGQYDVLRDDGEAYAVRLKNAGVPVTLNRFIDMNHGFINQGATYESADAALTLIGDSIKKTLGKK